MVLAAAACGNLGGDTTGGGTGKGELTSLDAGMPDGMLPDSKVPRTITNISEFCSSDGVRLLKDYAEAMYCEALSDRSSDARCAEVSSTTQVEGQIKTRFPGTSVAPQGITGVETNLVRADVWAYRGNGWIYLVALHAELDKVNTRYWVAKTMNFLEPLTQGPHCDLKTGKIIGL